MKTILAIDSDPQWRADIQDCLNSAGFRTLVARDKAAGIRLTETDPPDLVICGVATPEQGGREILEAIRSRGSRRYIPLIFTTETAERKNFRKGMELGADDCLAKPFSSQELLDAAIGCLKKQTTAGKFARQRVGGLHSSVRSLWPHVLNTPINQVISAAHLLSSHEDPDVREIADLLLEHSGHFVRLAQNFLCHAELKLLSSDRDRVRETQERGKKQPTTACTIESTARKKALRKDRIEDLCLNVEDILVPVPEEQVVKMVEELTDNAFRYSYPGTPVEVRVFHGVENLVLSVANVGSDIPCKRYMGAGSKRGARVRDTDSAGLGLSICRTIAEIHEGKLDIQNDAFGATVSVLFPLLECAACF